MFRSKWKMKRLISIRIVEGLILCGIVVSPCYSRNIKSDHQPYEGKQIIVELAIEGWNDVSRIKVPLAIGAGPGGGGGISPAVNISDYRLGLSVLELRKKEAILSFTMTLHLANGAERKIDERFRVRQGQKTEYQFAYGVKITTYFTARRKLRKIGRSTLAAALNHSLKRTRHSSALKLYVYCSPVNSAVMLRVQGH